MPARAGGTASSGRNSSPSPALLVARAINAATAGRAHRVSQRAGQGAARTADRPRASGASISLPAASYGSRVTQHGGLLASRADTAEPGDTAAGTGITHRIVHRP